MYSKGVSWTKSIGVAAAALACIALAAPTALAQNTRWSERTILQFDRPVMIPGKVLQPGTYIFQLADTRADRNIMQVYTADPNAPDQEQRLVATTVTVPTQRAKPNGEVVLKFATTQGDDPIALKAFFYPGTVEGHQFVYSEPEAEQIAERTHTLVLSHDVKGNDMERGTLYTVDANGTRTAWQQDPDVARDWDAWVVTRHPAHNTAMVGTSGHTAPDAATTTMTHEHAEAIQHLVDQALHAKGNHVTIDRSTLEQIRSHAEAIEHDGGSR